MRSLSGITTFLAIAFALTDPVAGQNLIRQYNPVYTEGVHYTISQQLRRVTIIAGIANQDFKFEAIDPSDPEGLGLIDRIEIAGPGAGFVNLQVNGDSGQAGPMLADKVGSVAAYGDLLGRIAPRNEIAGDITSTITMHANLLGGIYGDSIASVTVNGAGPHTGNIYRRDTSTQTGNITISGSYGGDITMSGAVTGNINIGADLTASGEFFVEAE
jgi:hypothetical protein